MLKPLFSLSCICLGIAMVLGCDAPAPPAEPVAHKPMPPATAEKAVAGVGKRGQSLADNTGIAKAISEPANVFFKLEQKAVLEWNIPQALSYFQASEGRMPKSHEEFMTKIVEANKLVLPELPAGRVYQFNPEKGELWVYPEDQVPAQP